MLVRCLERRLLARCGVFLVQAFPVGMGHAKTASRAASFSSVMLAAVTNFPKRLLNYLAKTASDCG